MTGAPVPLLPAEAFAPVFEPLRGLRVAYARMPGNVGDRLIDLAAFGLLRAFAVDFVIAEPPARPAVDGWVIAGGGNMGDLYAAPRRVREQVLAQGLPVTVLPQSFYSPEPLPYARVFVRERDSLRHCPAGVLAPDLALGLGCRFEGPPDRGEALWLRRDCEGLFKDRPSAGDPVACCARPLDYLQLAGRHAHVITDRLHFAIAALLCGRAATLLPNAYHKNRGMFDTWLRDLGCRWRDAP